MGKRTTAELTSALSVRIPADLRAELVVIAQARGIDLSALINDVLANARPGLRTWLREHRAALAGGNGKE